MKDCRRCSYWQGIGEDLDRDDPSLMGRKVEAGLCRRYAPKPGGGMNGNGAAHDHESLWPKVASDEWCGEWQPDAN